MSIDTGSFHHQIASRIQQLSSSSGQPNDVMPQEPISYGTTPAIAEPFTPSLALIMQGLAVPNRGQMSYVLAQDNASIMGGEVIDQAPSTDPNTTEAFGLLANPNRTEAENQRLAYLMTILPEDDLALLLHTMSPADFQEVMNSSPHLTQQIAARIAVNPHIGNDLRLAIFNAVAALPPQQAALFASSLPGDQQKQFAEVVAATGNRDMIVQVALQLDDPEALAILLLAVKDDPGALNPILEQLPPRTLEDTLVVIANLQESGTSSGFPEHMGLDDLDTLLTTAAACSPQARANLFVSCNSAIERIGVGGGAFAWQMIDVMLTGCTKLLATDPATVVGAMILSDPNGHALSTYTEMMLLDGRESDVVAFTENYAADRQSNPIGENENAHERGYVAGSIVRGVHQAREHRQDILDDERALVTGLVGIVAGSATGRASMIAEPSATALMDWLLDQWQQAPDDGATLLNIFESMIEDHDIPGGPTQASTEDAWFMKGYNDVINGLGDSEDPLDNDDSSGWPLP